MTEIPEAYRAVVEETLMPYSVTYEELIYEPPASQCPKEFLPANYVIRTTFLVLADLGVMIPNTEFYQILNKKYRSNELITPLISSFLPGIEFHNSAFSYTFPGLFYRIFYLPQDNFVINFDKRYFTIVLTDNPDKYVQKNDFIVIPIDFLVIDDFVSQNLLTVKQKQIEMCRLRGYKPLGLAINDLPIVEESYLHDDLFAFNQRLQVRRHLPHTLINLKGSIRYSLFTSNYCSADASTQIAIYYTDEIPDGGKIVKAKWTELFRILFDVRINKNESIDISDRISNRFPKIKLVLISNGTMQDGKIKHLNSVMPFQLIPEKSLRYFLFDSVLSPNYEILSSFERAQFYAEWKLTRDEMPPIMASDAAMKILDVSANTIIRITQNLTVPTDKIEPLVPINITYRST